MTDQNSDHKNDSFINLKTLSQEELESKIDSLLAKCRTEVDIKATAERGAMFRKGPFQISISLAVKMKKYQDELLYCRRNPYDVLLSVCEDNGWSAPEFRAIDYIPGEGFLFSVVVNDHELVSKWRDRRPLLAADLASANFLRYLGLWVNVKNLNLFFDWEQITHEDFGYQNKEVGNLNGYLYFTGFNVVKTEETIDEQCTHTSELSLAPIIHSQLAKLMYVFLTSRGEKIRWLTDIDIEFFKRIYGDFDPDPSYAFENKSWKSQVVCSCRKKSSKICFDHEECFFCLMLKDYYYVDKFGPVDATVFEKIEGMKKEIEENDIKETLQEIKHLVHEKTFDKFKEIEKEEKETAKYYTEGTSKQSEVFSYGKTSNFKIPHIVKKRPTSPVMIDPTETPINLRENKFDLRSKLFGEIKVENPVEKEIEAFKICFDNFTGLSNIKSSVGNWISVADITPPAISVAERSSKRPAYNNITVITSKRQKKKVA